MRNMTMMKLKRVGIKYALDFKLHEKVYKLIIGNYHSLIER